LFTVYRAIFPDSGFELENSKGCVVWDGWVGGCVMMMMMMIMVMLRDTDSDDGDE